MRIAYVTPWLVPELGYEENLLPDAISRAGHEVQVFTSAKNPPNLHPSKDLYEGESATAAGTNIIRLPARQTGPRRHRITLQGLRNQVTSFGPDAILTNGLWTITTWQLSGVMRTIPTVIGDHTDDDNLRLESWYRRALFWGYARVALPYLVRKAAGLTAANPYSREFLVRHLGLLPKRITTLPLGVDTHIFKPTTQRARRVARKELGLSQNTFVFCTSGRLEPTKRIDMLIDAFRNVSESSGPMALLIVGEGSGQYLAELRQLAAAAKGKVHFIPWQSQAGLRRLYAASDCAVLPNKLGGLRDALGVGLPFIVSRHPSVEYLISNANGLAFERGSCAGLARCMQRMAEMAPDQRQALANHSIELATRQLSWDTLATNLIAWLTTTLPAD